MKYLLNILPLKVICRLRVLPTLRRGSGSGGCLCCWPVPRAGRASNIQRSRCEFAVTTNNWQHAGDFSLAAAPPAPRDSLREGGLLGRPLWSLTQLQQAPPSTLLQSVNVMLQARPPHSEELKKRASTKTRRVVSFWTLTLQGFFPCCFLSQTKMYLKYLQELPDSL